mgnify:CR=1 FL=1|tara:strand:- start:106 stop:654 length:549 start_codon:yes stop_codon:yes gene_type:complete
MIFSGDIDADCYIMQDIMSQLEYKSGADRYKLCPTTKGNGSILYGNTWRAFLKKGENGENICRKKDPNDHRRYLSKAQEQNPELLPIFQEFRNLHFKDFDFSHVMMNKSYPVDWHFDKANIGESVVIAMGDFTGGHTQIMDEEGKITNLDTHNKPHKFDGSKIKHRVEPFEGERYALVFFKN